jgi:hypothetical protein
MLMKDWMTLIDTVSPAVCYDSGIHPRILRMWSYLRRGCQYFMRYQPGQHSRKHWEKAQRDLLTYAALAEKELGQFKLMTFQLHATVVHLTEYVQFLRT